MTRPGIREALWMAAGAAVLLAVVLGVFHFRDDRTPAVQLAARTERVAAVDRMAAALASAAAAEKSSVLAVTDEDSKAYADESRAALADVERERRTFVERLGTGGTQAERDALAQFTELFAEVRRIDEEVLDLAVRNTNLKASALLFGPAADALEEMSSALGRVVAARVGSPDADRAAILARGAEIGALRAQTLLAPHIAEETDATMDALEARMTRQDETVRRDLAELAAVPGLAGNGDLAAAKTSYDRLVDVRAQILALSRENTNVRSLSISLHQKVKAMRLCRDALAALRQAVLDESLAGERRRPVSPR